MIHDGLPARKIAKQTYEYVETHMSHAKRFPPDFTDPSPPRLSKNMLTKSQQVTELGTTVTASCTPVGPAQTLTITLYATTVVTSVETSVSISTAQGSPTTVVETASCESHGNGFTFTQTETHFSITTCTEFSAVTAASTSGSWGKWARRF